MIVRIDLWSHWHEMPGTQELQELGTLFWASEVEIPSLLCAVSFLG